MFGQELNPESYAICKADMLIRGQDINNIIIAGNTLSEDGHLERRFDYMLSNPPFGVEWKKVQKEMRKSLGSKRKEMNEAQIAEMTRLFGECAEADLAIALDDKGKEVSRQVIAKGAPPSTMPEGCKVKIAPLSRLFKTEAFGYRTITIERPLRDGTGEVVLHPKGKLKGKPMADSKLRDTENVPLGEDVEAYFRREVLPHAADAWIDPEKTKVGYEIPFNRHFYVFEPPRSLETIDAELKTVSDRILKLIGGLSG
jgi:type I restriction enzyme M protein